MNIEDFVVMISRKTDRMQRVEFYCQPHDFGLRRTRRSTMAIVKPLRQPTLVSAGASWSRSIPYGLFVIVLPSTTPTAIVGICWNEVHGRKGYCIYQQPAAAYDSRVVVLVVEPPPALAQQRNSTRDIPRESYQLQQQQPSGRRIHLVEQIFCLTVCTRTPSGRPSC